MDIRLYKSIVEKHKANEKKGNYLVRAFLIGGLVGALGEILMCLYMTCLNISRVQAGTLMIITLIFIGCLFTALGFFDKWVNYARCGLLIPITGFAHSIMSSMLEYKKEGLVIGIGENAFKLAGTVIVYGVVSAFFLGIIRLLLGVA